MKELDDNNLPNHIAIILDGNGRWAKSKGLPRNLGHRKGAFNIRKIAKACIEIGIPYLTVFCFSTENWKRPEKEVNYIMTAPIKFFTKFEKNIEESNIKIKFIGRKDRFNLELLNIINKIEDVTKDHNELTLTICADYGSYEEITHAVKNIALKVKNNEISIDDINEKMIEDNLYTSGYPKLDLLIRTSGEQRISNFLLWQLAYSELYFTDIYWPDFNKDSLIDAIYAYQHRNRRFGGLKENGSNKN